MRPAKASVALCPPMNADPDLAKVAAAWPALPPAVKAGILAMIEATRGQGAADRQAKR